MTGTISSETPKHDRSWLAVAFLSISVLILAIDDAVLNLALPPISREFEASTSQLQWAINAYLLGFAALLLTMGSVGDRFGRKRMFLAGLILLGISSLGAALSVSMDMLIACRALMGIGGAMVLPQTLSIIRATFEDPKQRVQAIGVWAGVYGLGYGIGPAIGGILIDRFDWNSVFLFNIPFAVAAFAGGYYFVRESRDRNAPGLDFIGILLSATGLSALVYGIIEAGERSWAEGSVVIWLSIGAVLLAFFILWERHSPHPMLPMRFFKNMSFTGANAAMTLGSFSVGAMLFFLSQYFQSVQDRSTLEAALLMLPGGVITMAGSMAASPISRAVGVKLPISAGLLIASLGLFYLAFVPDPGTSYPVILPGMALVSIGFGLIWSPATDSVMGSLPESRAGVGSAMDTTNQTVGMVLGVAVLGAIMNGIYLDKVASVASALPEGAGEAVRSSIQGAHITAAELPEDTAQLIVSTSNEAFTSGMVEAMLVGAIVMVGALLIVWRILPARITVSPE